MSSKLCAVSYWTRDRLHWPASVFHRHFFNCPLSKKCVPFYQRCDGYSDCPSNEDENDCQGSCPWISSVFIAVIIQIWCLALTCDKSTNRSTSFRCSSSSKCLTAADLCNNVTDCVQGEDEHDLICGHFCEWPSLSTCDSKNTSVQRQVSDYLAAFLEKYPNLCSDVEFYCDGKCVPISHRCDRTPYCCT